MATGTRNPPLTIIAAAIATTTLVSIATGAELRSTASETGETRELVNRLDCWPGDGANGWNRCLVR
jgi:hypothetical protein